MRPGSIRGLAEESCFDNSMHRDGECVVRFSPATSSGAPHTLVFCCKKGLRRCGRRPYRRAGHG